MALTIFVLGNFGWPFAHGYMGNRIGAIPLFALIVAGLTVMTGWRAEGLGVLSSVLIGAVFSLMPALLFYFAGRWIGGTLSLAPSPW